MMRLPPFSYIAPRTVTDAARLLAEHGRDAMLVAGGTDLYPNMKRRQFEPKVLVALGGIPELKGVHGSSREGLRIGATTTLTAVSRHPEVAHHYAALATAAGLVSSPQLRNMGTLGGNVCVDTRCNYYNQSYAWRKAIGFCMKKDGDICLVAPGSPRCWAVSSSDTAPVLWSLSARLRLVGPGGERVIPIGELYRDDGIEYLAKRPDEIVADILLPPAAGWRSVYLKLRRRGSFDFPVLGVAVAVRFDGDAAGDASTAARGDASPAARADASTLVRRAGGMDARREGGIAARREAGMLVRDARIVLGAVASLPREAKQAAATLVGERLTPELIARVADLAAGPAKPLDNTDYAHFYRKKMTRVFVTRALRRLAGLEPDGGADAEVA